jgi:hypothetical protein
MGEGVDFRPGEAKFDLSPILSGISNFRRPCVARSSVSVPERRLNLARRSKSICSRESTINAAYELFGNHEVIRTKVRELRFPAHSSVAPRRAINLPYESLGSFKGRDEAIGELRQQLRRSGGKPVNLKARQVLHGLGGAGKTRFAIEYGWRPPT